MNIRENATVNQLRTQNHGAGAPLVSVTKTSSSPLKSNTWKAPFCNKETGEEVFFQAPKREQRDYRADRWAFKSVVNKLLPRSRTSKCMRYRGFDSDGVSVIKIMKSVDKKAFYSGLMACGSVWNCPICSAKVSEKRRLELKSALEKSKDMDMKVYLVTLTVPHGVGDDLKALRLKIRKAQGKLSSGRGSVKNALESLHPHHVQHGFVRTLEVTHGRKNGFHPHLHLLVFTSRSVTKVEVDEVYTSAWLKACVSSGLPLPTEKHGCHVQSGDSAGSYIAKWGLESEMTKANSKVTKDDKGMSPFGLLKCVLDGDNSFYTQERASRLFTVYSKSFKGARQLYWSNGLRKLLDMNSELSDQELVDTKDDEAFTMGVLSFDQWKIIRKKRLEASLLTLTETKTLQDLKDFIFNVTDLHLISHKNELEAYLIKSPVAHDKDFYKRYYDEES